MSSMTDMAMGTPIPAWVGVVGACVFAAIACSHLRHMLAARGQRAPWHSCHVLMALSMVYMYVPAGLAQFGPSSELWRLVFACAGLAAAAWALVGAQRLAVFLWLVTSLGLFTMFYMWAPDRISAPITWPLVTWLALDALLWSLDAYRRVEGSTPIVRLAVLGGTGETAAEDVPAELIGELDISVSMVAMSAGMIFMLLAMQLAR